VDRLKLEIARALAAASLLLGCSDAAPEIGLGPGDAAAASLGDATLDAPLIGPSGGADAPEGGASVTHEPCASGMARVGTYCIDRWEAYVVEVDLDGKEYPHSPYLTVDGLTIRAKTAAGVVPQGYISQLQASQACFNAGKRLCTEEEFHTACAGASGDDWYPYGGQTHLPGYCNEGKGSMVAVLYGSDPSQWSYADFNDPRLNQIDGGLASTGSFPRCTSPYGISDCVGNLHEWGADPADAKGRGRFRGGFYGDAEVNGHGCLYVTSAHELAYHDYSTGFRCCADAKP
jgi:hypothetical protein